MQSKLKITSLTDQSQSIESWESVIQDLKKDVEIEYENKLNCDVSDLKALTDELSDTEIILVDVNLKTKLKKIVQHSSVPSHFLRYFDYIEKRKNKWWGFSLYSEVFYKVLLSAIKNQDYKGSVIFLGVNPEVLPIVEVLTGFGFDDFVFLNSKNDDSTIKNYFEQLKGFIGASLSVVDSTTFIQSQKEYSLCFIMDREYDRQTLDDMSYFHFLSNQSMVFDVVASKNFLFKEVKALGVDVVEYDAISTQFNMVYSHKIRQFLKDHKDE